MYLKACRILGVRVGANQAEIKKAYRGMAKKYHPDVSAERNAKEKFIQVRRAYQHLSHVDSYQHFLNRHNPSRRRPVNNPHRPSPHRSTRRYTQNYERASYRVKDEGVEAPEYVIKLGTFLERVYDYIFLIIGGIMIISPPIYFILDDELEIEEAGWNPIVVPAIVGMLFMLGVYSYMIRQRHPFAVKVKHYVLKLWPWRISGS